MIPTRAILNTEISVDVSQIGLEPGEYTNITFHNLSSGLAIPIKIYVNDEGVPIIEIPKAHVGRVIVKYVPVGGS